MHQLELTISWWCFDLSNLEIAFWSIFRRAFQSLLAPPFVRKKSQQNKIASQPDSVQAFAEAEVFVEEHGGRHGLRDVREGHIVLVRVNLIPANPVPHAPGRQKRILDESKYQSMSINIFFENTQLLVIRKCILLERNSAERKSGKRSIKKKQHLLPTELCRTPQFLLDFLKIVHKFRAVSA